jgi:hypothetical protein
VVLWMFLMGSALSRSQFWWRLWRSLGFTPLGLGHRVVMALIWVLRLPEFHPLPHMRRWCLFLLHAFLIGGSHPVLGEHGGVVRVIPQERGGLRCCSLEDCTRSS